MTENNGQPGFRKAYVFKPGSVGGMTPADQIESAVIEIVQRWNAMIPKNHVRILTTMRFASVRTALAKFHLSEILLSIEFYSRQTWQRGKGAWKTFDNFFYADPPKDPPVLEWLEKAISAAEKAEQRKPIVDPRVRKLQQQIFDKQADMNKWDALKKQFDGLDQARRNKLLKAADAELRRLCGSQTNIGPHRLQHHALVVLNRENSTK